MSVDKRLVVLLLIFFFSKLLIINHPNTTVMDEYYYINHVHESVFGTYPNRNTEHPPLAKAFIALGITLFPDFYNVSGDLVTCVGWRIFSIIFGTLTVLLFYNIVLHYENRDLALLSSVVLCLDNMFYVHTQLALLDPYSLFFMTVSLYLALCRKKYSLSAFFLALSCLSKLTGILGFLILSSFYILHTIIKVTRKDLLLLNLSSLKSLKVPLTNIIKFLFIFSLSFLSLLSITYSILYYNSSIYYIPYNSMNMEAADVNPIAQTLHMLSYHTKLSYKLYSTWDSPPEYWLHPLHIIQYTNLTIFKNGFPIGNTVFQYTYIEKYFAQSTPLIATLSLISIPYLVFRVLKHKESSSLFFLCWFCFTFFPWLFIHYIQDRITYIFYLFPTIPSIAFANTKLLYHRKTRTLLYVYILLTAFLFLLFYPVQFRITGVSSI